MGQGRRLYSGTNFTVVYAPMKAIHILSTPVLLGTLISKKDVDRLERIQKFALKVCCGDWNSSYENSLLSLSGVIC